MFKIRLVFIWTSLSNFKLDHFRSDWPDLKLDHPKVDQSDLKLDHSKVDQPDLKLDHSKVDQSDLKLDCLRIDQPTGFELDYLKEKAGPVLENQSFQAVCGTAPGPPAISLVSPELWIYLCCHGARLKSAPAHILNQKRDLVDTFFHGCRAARHNTYKQTSIPLPWSATELQS